MTDPVYFEVVNLDKYQHYKDRCPPWIKLHAAVFDDYDHAELPDASKWHLAAIWLLASRTKNRLRLDPHWIARRAALSDIPDLAFFVSEGWIRVCDDCKQGATEALAECSAVWRERRGEKSRGEESRGDSALSVFGVGAPGETDPDGSPLGALANGMPVDLFAAWEKLPDDWRNTMMNRGNSDMYVNRSAAVTGVCGDWMHYYPTDPPLDGKPLLASLYVLGFKEAAQ